MEIKEVLNYLHTPTSFWILLEIALVLFIAIILKYANKTSFSIMIDFFYEKIYSFFEEILWNKEKIWIKTYVTILFFIIFLSNFLWIILEIISPIFWFDTHWEFILEHYISIPSRNINFNLAVASISIIVILFIQFRHLWLKQFYLEYFPVKWKWYLVLQRWDKKAIFYYPMFIFVKLFDIIISLFLWLLEVVWLFAKIISLSFRLFWNMTSWAILLAMVIFWMNTLTQELLSFNFPILLPVLIYLQEILVSLIQALVFPLLISIFIKVAISEENEG